MTGLPPRLLKDLTDAHLQILGGFQVTLADGLGPFQTLVMIGPNEPGFWPHFKNSAEARDGDPDPLDRWSRRLLDQIALPHHGQARFPFGGPPFQPFYTWALRTGRFWPSPIGFLAHDTAGLFASFRGALLLPNAVTFEPGQSPCDTCADQPCATACPVGAFDDGYDVATCKAHLSVPAGADCLNNGCLARRACPVGQSLRRPAQSAFHMKAFL